MSSRGATRDALLFAAGATTAVVVGAALRRARCARPAAAHALPPSESGSGIDSDKASRLRKAWEHATAEGQAVLREELCATCSSPTNIAVIKYWGKRDKALNLPINGSLSATLDQAQLRTVTTVAAVPRKAGEGTRGRDRLWLNGKEEEVAQNKRIQAVLAEMRALANDRVVNGKVVATAEELRGMAVHIASTNTFPTAAGLASSASGYACLVRTLAELYSVDPSKCDLTPIARQGSGSACRSLAGGFVKWDVGTANDGLDSCATQVVDEHHWPEMRVIVLVASDQQKETSSTSGMQDSVRTSPLLAHRAESIVPERLARMVRACEERDFNSFARLTMEDSNQFHATCLDTYPPIFYMSAVSQKVVSVVHAHNARAKELRVAYTFDAGPNAVLFVRQQHVTEVLTDIMGAFPGLRCLNAQSGAGARAVSSEQRDVWNASAAAAATAAATASARSGSTATGPCVLKGAYLTSVGRGPEVLDSVSEGLLDPVTGGSRGE